MGKQSRYFMTEDDNNNAKGAGQEEESFKKQPPSSTSSPGLQVKTYNVVGKKPSKGWRKFAKESSGVVESGRVNKFKRKKKSSTENKPTTGNKNKEGDQPLEKPPSLPKDKLSKYSRGLGLVGTKSEKFIRTQTRRAKLIAKDKKITSGVERAARSEILLAEQSGAIEVPEGDHTLQLRQYDLTGKVDIATATKGFHLSLDQYGPYCLSYTPNGRYLALGGRKGHIAAFDWVTKQLMCEMGVQENVNDVVWLHNENMFAVAQQKWTYVYDKQGIEIHCLKSMDRVQKLEFLPYHFLLVGGHESGFLSWVDVSIGKVIAQFNSLQGNLSVLCSNPGNAVVHCGHSNGTVTLWAPSVKKPLASILCHGCPVSSLSIDNIGRLMATTGRDGSLRIWDLRNSFTPLTSIKVGPVTSTNFSQRGLLAVAKSNQTMVFTEVGYKEKPYLKHTTSTQVSCVKFCPFEDILGVGTARGFDSILVPGAGEPNFDALERNPFQTKAQRREAEVKSLLEKIQPELISLDNKILGEVDTELLKDKASSKPDYLKKADIQLAHRKKRKNARMPEIKDALRSELNLKTLKANRSKNGASKDKKKDGATKVTEYEDPLDRFIPRKK